MLVFFFQAEDGIRDLVRSRGLGDVYKRQTGDLATKIGATVALGLCIIELHELNGRGKLDFPFSELVQAPLDPFSSGIARAV